MSPVHKDVHLVELSGIMSPVHKDVHLVELSGIMSPVHKDVHPPCRTLWYNVTGT